MLSNLFLCHFLILNLYLVRSTISIVLKVKLFREFDDNYWRERKSNKKEREIVCERESERKREREIVRDSKRKRERE